MNKKNLLKHTANYENDLIGRLKKDPELAQGYLETAFNAYKKEGNIDALLLAMRDVAKAQGGISELAKRVRISRGHLYHIFANKHNPRLDNWLNIIAGLGFRVRLEQQGLPVQQ